ncbi:MAG: redox-regulated ATPase YchF [Candidatus Saccharimonadales bacterium]
MSSQVSCGIVGLPNVGKSTLFNSLTKARVLVANYPFATIDPNVGIVEVADDRLKVLAKMYNSDKIVPATLSITDIAGLVAGASNGEGLGNQFLSHIRSCKAIVQVVRAFTDSAVTHVDEDHDPKKDIEIINNELVLADLETLDKKLPKIIKEAKSNPKLNELIKEYQDARDILDQGQPLWGANVENALLADLQLLTMKPTIYLFNVDENDIGNHELNERLSKLVEPTPSLFVCAKLEAELTDLDEEDQKEMLLSYGLNQSALSILTTELYKLLGLQSFITAGKKEVKAWTIKSGSTAPQAAGAIHSDFERGFIAADVVSYSDLVASGSLVAARAAGKVRTEGKNYIVKDDDVIEFKFNVTR